LSAFLYVTIASIEAFGYNTNMTISHGSSRAARQKDDLTSGSGVQDALDAAFAYCRSRGISLTPGRQRILTILAREGRPLGAYDLIEKVAEETGKRPAPISIYRALDFLLENSLVHRLASRNMFLACGHAHEAQEPIVFLICEHCGGVVEATSKDLRGSLAGLAAQARFAPRATMMEVAGRCEACEGV
jgi:Fur family zinc uptake transcriptional regulator